MVQGTHRSCFGTLLMPANEDRRFIQSVVNHVFRASFCRLIRLTNASSLKFTASKGRWNFMLSNRFIRDDVMEPDLTREAITPPGVTNGIYTS